MARFHCWYCPVDQILADKPLPPMKYRLIKARSYAKAEEITQDWLRICLAPKQEWYYVLSKASRHDRYVMYDAASDKQLSQGEF